MEYSQSLANISSIKAHIRLFKDTSCIFFDFNNLKNFKVIFVDNATDLQGLRAPKYEQDLPFATMYINKSGQEILIYEDVSLKLHYNLTFEHTTLSDIQTDFSKPQNRKKLLTEFSLIMARVKK